MKSVFSAILGIVMWLAAFLTYSLVIIFSVACIGWFSQEVSELWAEVKTKKDRSKVIIEGVL